MGESRNPSDPVSYGLDPKTATLRLKFRVQRASFAALAVKSSATNRVQTLDNGGLQASLPSWEAVLFKERLYVFVTAQQLNVGSKEAFVYLLEYAEDVLGCGHVIICLAKKNAGSSLDIMNNKKNLLTNAGKPSTVDNATSDRDTKMAIRNFLFLGFKPLAPGHEFMPSYPNAACFVYTI